MTETEKTVDTKTEENEARLEKVQAKTEITPKSGKQLAASYLVKIALLASMSVVLLLLEFPLLAAVPHLKLNISDLPALLAAFMFGPVSGVVVSSIKVGATLLMRGTSTAFVGDISNLISGALYAGVAGLIYKLKKSKRGALLALAISSVVFCGAMWLCNQYFLLPMFGMSAPEILYPMLWWTLLFNVIKIVLTSVLTFIAYKEVHKLFRMF